MLQQVKDAQVKRLGYVIPVLWHSEKERMLGMEKKIRSSLGWGSIMYDVSAGGNPWAVVMGAWLRACQSSQSSTPKKVILLPASKTINSGN